MARTVRWAGCARSDLRVAVEYIRKDSPRSAQEFLSRTLETARSLRDLPERGRTVPELSDPDVHEVFVGRYRLLFEIHSTEIWIMRLIHGSRDLLLALEMRRNEVEPEGG